MSVVVDVVAVVLVALNIFIGWRHGLISRALAFAGIYGGLAAATFAGNSISRSIHGNGSADDLYAAAWTFLGITALVIAMVEILAVLYRDRIQRTATLAFDRTAGMVAGALVGVLEVGVLVLVLLAVGDAHASPGQTLPPDRTSMADSLRGDALAGRLATVADGVRNVFAPSLPGDLSSHLAETTVQSN